MSKKKSFSGNTMTLKDFHGGSIPSDLPLPSAPGVIVRPVDRPSFDRQTNWGSQMGRSDHRLRPGSSGSMRNLDDKTPFLTNTAHIGRNFDEDERKPLDGASAPRRTVSDESIRGAPLTRSEPKGDVARFSGQSGLGPVVAPPQVGAISASSYSARVVEGGNSGVGSRPDAWGVRKEAVAVVETVSSPWIGHGQSTVSKFAQASALDKISSGRWQTKAVHQQADIEGVRQSGSPNRLYGRENDSYGGGINFGAEREYYEATLVRHAERGLSIEEGIRYDGIKEMPGFERMHSPVGLDGPERSGILYTNEGQPTYPESKYGVSQSQLPAEVSERPKLKLLPRTKPLDAPEASIVDYQQHSDASLFETGGQIQGNAAPVKPGFSGNEASHLKPGLSGSEEEKRFVERQKLNLKPRSQPVAHPEGSAERERMALFGGARPREMVLKERGVDDINNQEQVQVPHGMKNEISRTEIAPIQANTSRHGEKVENLSVDHRAGRGQEKREQRPDVEKPDVQKRNWRNENWRNSKDTDKQHQHQHQERQPSPETWRKPVEQPKLANPDSSGPRFGKAVSAVELAQAFSRPVSDPKSIDQISSQRGRSGRTQVPFSRLTGPPTRPQINGY